MAFLEIIKYPNPMLRKKCQKVKEITQDVKKLGEEMKETMIKNQGIGLAAPQVGRLIRLIVVQIEKGAVAFINPEIVKRSKETEIMEEGCLSFPGFSLKIKRAKEIKVEALNEKGEKIRFKIKGLSARVFQHEIDHLDGILFIDYDSD